MIQRLQDSYLYSENKYLLEQLEKVKAEKEVLVEQLRIQEQLEEELIFERNRINEQRELVEVYYKDTQYNLNKEKEQNKEYLQELNSKEQQILEITMKSKQLHEQAEMLQKQNLILQEENQQLKERNKELSIQNEALQTEASAKNSHLNDLNRTLTNSEAFKKDVVEKLVAKAAKLEGILVEKEQLLTRLHEAKEQLSQAEKVKLEFFKEVVNSYKAQLEDHEWWLSQQFADIDRTVSNQREKIEQISLEQDTSYNQLKKFQQEFQNSYDHVEEKFQVFLLELDGLKAFQKDIGMTVSELKDFVSVQNSRKRELKYNYTAAMAEKNNPRH